jgi:chemotaxis protein methyltransferase CheR
LKTNLKMINSNQNPNEIRTVYSDNWIQITDKEYQLLSEYVYNIIGINLTDQKRNLLMGRLQKLLREKKLKSFQEYYNYVVTDKTGAALSELANYISTNHTFFYREKDHFEYFQKTSLPEIMKILRKNNSNDLRIWSAGCSSGEEPYTLIMLMMETLGNDYFNLNAGILATDISEKALNLAKIGIYNEERVKFLPENYIKKYFNKLSDGQYQIIDRVKKEVTYRKFNLMNESFPFRKQFHIIFCRNVMIYFDGPTRRTLVNKFYKFITDDGYLFIGHSESLKRDEHEFHYIMPALYRK